MRKFIRFIFNLMLTLLIILAIIIGFYILNEYIIQSEEVSEIFSPIYDDEIITISKTPEGEIANPVNTIETLSNQNSNSSKVYYSQLDPYAAVIYNKLSENKENMKSGNYTIDFEKTFNELLNSENGSEKMNVSYQSALDAYFLDNPDIFYIDISKMYLLINSRTFGRKTTYTVKLGAQEGTSYYAAGFNTYEDVVRAIANTESVKNEMISYAVGNDYEKIKKLHNLMVDNISYDTTMQKSNTRNVYGALYEGEVVCEGYAKAYKYLLDSIGIENIIVVGYATNSEGTTEEHAWNYVNLNNNWYAVDVTWDDPIIIGGGRLSDSNRYKYFLKGSIDFNTSHTATGATSEKGIVFTYPTLSVSDYK